MELASSFPRESSSERRATARGVQGVQVSRETWLLKGLSSGAHQDAELM